MSRGFVLIRDCPVERNPQAVGESAQNWRRALESYRSQTGRPPILVLSAHVPIPKGYQAGHRTLYSLLEKLAGEYEIHLFCFADEDERRLVDQRLLGLCCGFKLLSISWPRRALSIVRHPLLPHTVAIRSSARLRRIVRDFLDEVTPELALLEWTPMMAYWPDLRGRSFPAIADEHDVTYVAAERKFRVARNPLLKAYWGIEYVRLKKWELRALCRMDGVVAHSEMDAQRLRAEQIAPPIFRLQVPYLRGEEQLSPPLRQPASIVFWGAMDRVENDDAVLQFAQNALPRIWAKVPEAHFLVVGRNPSGRVRQLAKNDPRIVVTGFVEEPSHFLSRASVAVAPLRMGGGIKVKVLESMAHRLPTVLSPVAAEGIGGTDGQHYLLCRSEEEFAESVVRLLSDSKLAKTIGEGGYRLVAAEFDFARSFGDLVEFYRQLVGMKRASGNRGAPAGA